MSNEEQTSYLTGAIHVLNGKYRDAILILKPEEELVIGRDVSICHLILEAPWVSRKHCTVAYDREKKKYLVTNFSENGTFIQDTVCLPKGECEQLKPGTELVIGEEGIRILLL